MQKNCCVYDPFQQNGVNNTSASVAGVIMIPSRKKGIFINFSQNKGILQFQKMW